MVASTEHAAATGDERWRAVLHRFGEITADLTERFGGTVVKSTGDGHLITFDGPTQAIRCAEALRDHAESLGIEIRAGIHTGECELLGTDIGGIAVHIAARILGQAGVGEILVDRTVRDLVVGSGTGFEDRGSVELRGVPGTWQLLAVDRDGARVGIGRSGTGVDAHPRRSDRDAPVGPRRGGDGQADTVDPPRDGPPLPGTASAAEQQPESSRSGGTPKPNLRPPLCAAPRPSSASLQSLRSRRHSPPSPALGPARGSASALPQQPATAGRLVELLDKLHKRAQRRGRLLRSGRGRP